MDSAPSRREFLASLAAGASLALLGDRLRAAEDAKPGNPKPARAPFGFSLYGMRSLKTADALKTCSTIGYDAVELVCNEGWPCDPASLSADDRRTIRTQLADHKLELPALMENVSALATGDAHRKVLDRLKAAAELGHALSPESPPVVETILGGAPAKWDEQKGPIAAALKDWARIGEQTRTVFAIKPHVGGALHTPEGALWLLGEVDSPWIRLTYDFSHYRLRDFDLVESLKQLLPKSVFVHVKDAKGTAAAFQFVLPGDGDIDYIRYFKHLKDSSYRGGIVVEVSGQVFSKPGYDPIAAARHSYENLAPAFEIAGLQRK